jgi:hypothetical protein
MPGVFAMLSEAAVIAATLAAPAARPDVRVVVRTEGHVSLDPRRLVDVLDGVHAIWRPYADLTFEPSMTDTAPRDAVQLVITERTINLAQGASLGWIEFVDGQPSHTITVSVTAVTALMERSRWRNLPPIAQTPFLVRALIRSVAHEIGHFLLGSRDHAARGLMRGRLTADDIMDDRRANVRLDRAQIEQLRRGAVELARR